MPHQNDGMFIMPIMISSTKVERLRITCRCTREWTEQVPRELHESSVKMHFFCPSCGAEFSLQNKKFARSGKTRSDYPTEPAMPGTGWVN